MRMWTVYDHPLDYPDHFVARLWEVTPAGSTATASIITATDIEKLRDTLEFEMGLAMLLRDPNDDPAILEIWL